MITDTLSFFSICLNTFLFIGSTIAEPMAFVLIVLYFLYKSNMLFIFSPVRVPGIQFVMFVTGQIRHFT